MLILAAAALLLFRCCGFHSTSSGQHFKNLSQQSLPRMPLVKGVVIL